MDDVIHVGFGLILQGVFTAAFVRRRVLTLAIQLTPHFETCEYEVLTLVAEKKDLLVDHGGKNKDYNFYRHAGVAMVGDKGTHIKESKPVDLKSNLP